MTKRVVAGNPGFTADGDVVAPGSGEVGALAATGTTVATGYYKTRRRPSEPSASSTACGAPTALARLNLPSSTRRSPETSASLLSPAPPSDERAVIRQAVGDLESYSGRKVRGWLGPGLQETFDTPDVLAECGIKYVRDWVLDDVPVWLHATPRPLVAVPYSLDLNDSVVYAVERHPSPEI